MEKKNIEQLRQERRAQSVASVLAIGTANPSNCIDQSDYPDYYFRVTNCDHLTELKAKFSKICQKTMIRQRYFHTTEKILKENPSITTAVETSLDARMDILVDAVPKLGAEAAERAIKEWGQPRSNITHLIFCTISNVDMPSSDLYVARLLGLNPSVNRLCMYHQGCFTSGTALRLAKDITESNKHARVLIICSEINLVNFRGPSDFNIYTLISQAMFGDGAAALIIGADHSSTERPIYEIISARQTTLPDTESIIYARFTEAGLTFNSKKELTSLIGFATEKCVNEAFAELGISDWNSLFWVMHPGAPAFADHIEEKMGLKKGKLHATRHVLREYGNMESPSVLFVLDQMRKHSAIEGKTTTGEGLEWGVLLGFGPGLTVETVVLRSLPY